MPEAFQILRETNIAGAHTRQWGIGQAACPALAAHHIRGLGSAKPGRGYRIIRLIPSFSHINICLTGAARYLVNGHWETVSAGQALIFPSRHPHGAQWRGSRDWRMAWVIYEEPPGVKPLIQGLQTRVVRADSEQFEWTLEGLRREIQTSNEPAHLQHWIDLVHLLTRRVVQPERRASRLEPAWARVEENPARPWTVSELATLTHMSDAHLRRLCQGELGRSPMQQVSWLRVRHAASLLESHAQTVEVVAWSVGYQSVSAFTAAYKRWLGRPPRGEAERFGN